MKNKIIWHQNGSFSFVKGSRPSWTNQAAKIALKKGEDRRHGLHGDAVITHACEVFINNELQQKGSAKTTKRLFRNLSTRINPLLKLDLKMLINTFRKYAFSHIKNILPGDGSYNKAIEATRKRLKNVKNKWQQKFFSDGTIPIEIDLNTAKKYALQLLTIKEKETKGSIKSIVDELILEIVQPMIKESCSLYAIDQVFTSLIDSTTLDIAFDKTKRAKKFNKRVLRIDKRIKRAIANEEGLSRWLFNTLIGYPIPGKRPPKIK